MNDTSKIYVDIESLLDLRAGTLLQIAKKEELLDYLNSEEYNFRNIDKFNLVNQTDYDRIYLSKPVDLIPSSVITYILPTLKSKLDNLEKRNNYFSEKKNPEVLLNIYPFKLTNTQIKALQNMLFVKLETNTLVTVIDIPPKDLTPYFIQSSGVVSAFIYNFKDWMGHHTTALEKNKLTDVIIYFPSLYHHTPDEKEIQKITKLGFKDVFGYTEYLLSSVANISFLPVVFYSNLITASLYIDKFNDVLKDNPLSEESEQEKENVDSGSKIQVP